MNKVLINSAISAVIALGATGPVQAGQTTSNGQSMMDGPTLPGMERCFGVAKAGANDCGNASHHCAGEAKISRDKHEWIFVPTGLCKRIAGGKTSSSSHESA